MRESTETKEETDDQENDASREEEATSNDAENDRHVRTWNDMEPCFAKGACFFAV